MKKIEDYLHYYLGCECMEAIIVPGQASVFQRGEISIRTVFNIRGHQLSIVKPILRPLSDISDENYAYMAIEFTCLDANRNLAGAEREAIKMHYFISQGFDVFGLIKEGLAIDKTTLTP
jgi:hypothetical protein